MLHLALEMSNLDHERLSGVGVYIRELSHALQARRDTELTGLVKLSRWRKHKIIAQHWPGQLKPYLKWGEQAWGVGAPQVLHGPDFWVPQVSAPLARVVTIHDLAFFEEGLTSQDFAKQKIEQLENQLRKQPPTAIITVSEFTKGKVIERYPHLASRTFAVHLGGDHLPLSTPATCEREDFLFVGNLEARKNVVGVLRAFESFCAKLPQSEARLHLVGRPGFGYDEIASALAHHPQRARVIEHGYMSGSELSSLYSRALAFVYPSWHEGFGIPVLEAMRLGCPVITSHQSATREVAGDAALLVAPQDHEQLARAMLELAQNREKQQILSASGLKRAQTFTWSKCAQQTFAVYRWALEQTQKGPS